MNLDILRSYWGNYFRKDCNWYYCLLTCKAYIKLDTSSTQTLPRSNYPHIAAHIKTSLSQTAASKSLNCLSSKRCIDSGMKCSLCKAMYIYLCKIRGLNLYRFYKYLFQFIRLFKQLYCRFARSSLGLSRSWPLFGFRY